MDEPLQQSELNDPADAELVSRFVTSRDEDAFNAIVRRHADLVMSVCRRRLGDSHDAEDAFQATFLVLAKDARRIRNGQSLASWLYGVAYRVSCRAGRWRQRRRREEEFRDQAMEHTDPLSELAERHDQQVVDEELHQLPEKYRSPLVLHDVAGRSCPDIAAELGVSVGSIEGRLKRARRQLRLRLARRGITLSVTAAVLNMSREVVEASVPETLLTNTIEAGLGYSGGVAPTHLCSDQAFQLAGKEMFAMTFTKPLIGTAVAALLITCGFGIRGAMPLLLADDGAGEAVGKTNVVDAVAKAVKDSRDTLPAVVSLPSSSTSSVSTSGGQYGGIDMRAEVASRTRIEQQLSTPIEQMDFIDEPLTTVIEFLEQVHEIHIEPDRPALEDVQIELDNIFVQINLSGLTLRSALRLILNQHDLDYVIRNQVMLITTREAAEHYLEVRIYKLPNVNALDLDGVESLIVNVLPDVNWMDRDTTGGTIGRVAGGLIITQNQRAHEQIAELLVQIDSAGLTLDGSRGLNQVKRPSRGSRSDSASAVTNR